MDKECGKEPDVAKLLGLYLARGERMLKLADSLDQADAKLEAVTRLLNEIDCRVEHGADSNGHLEYVEKRLRAILDAGKGE